MDGIAKNKYIILRNQTLLQRVKELYNDSIKSKEDHGKRIIAQTILITFNSQLNLDDASAILGFLKESLILNPCESNFQSTRV